MMTQFVCPADGRTGRGTDTHRGAETDRLTDRQREVQTERHRGRQTDSYTDRQTWKQSDGQAGRQTDSRQADRQSGTLADRHGNTIISSACRQTKTVW